MAPAIRLPGTALTGAMMLLLAVAACAPAPPILPELPRLKVATSFGLKNLCGLGVSPAIAVADAPQGTVRYRVRMSNLDVLWQTAWQDTLPATQSGIPEGAAPAFPAPCMGTYQQFRYRFEVMALDAGDRPLAYGQATAVAVALDRLASERRNAPRTPGAAAPAIPPGQPPVLDREDENALFGTLPYRNYGPVVAPNPNTPAE